MYQEINFDGIVGPTHNFAGLSEGNIASIASKDQISRPKEAALQGLRKMKALHDWGIPQAVLPPLERPSIHWLRSFGIRGTNDAAVLDRAMQDAPHLLAACSSASAMWTANAATMTPSCDTMEGRAHFTTANLSSKLHRAIEAPETHQILQHIFSDPEHFVVHAPLAGGQSMRDEGAANHTRLASSTGDGGTHVFVYGTTVCRDGGSAPQRFPARQTREASEAIARRHHIPDAKTVMVQQSPTAIDAGVFHNDVIAVGHNDVLFYHEGAFSNGEAAVDEIENACGHPLTRLRVSAEQVDLQEAVSSYLFNSQIVTSPDGSMMIVAPAESESTASTRKLLDDIVTSPDNPIGAVKFFDLRQSMRNGGGPACLRQRVVLNTEEQAAVRGRLFMSEALFAELTSWVNHHYREQLAFTDLGDPKLLDESRTALDELTGILQLGSIYPFQS